MERCGVLEHAYAACSVGSGDRPIVGEESNTMRGRPTAAPPRRQCWPRTRENAVRVVGDDTAASSSSGIGIEDSRARSADVPVGERGQ